MVTGANALPKVTRSGRYLYNEDGSRFFGDGYKFEPGKDDVILEGKAGYVVTFGEMVYRSYDAVLRCRQEGLDVGLVNKSTINLVDEEVSNILLVDLQSF